MRTYLATLVTVFTVCTGSLANAQSSANVESSAQQTSQDYQSALFFLNLPPSVRAEAGRRIAIAASGGLLLLIGLDKASSIMMAGLQRTVFATIIRLNVFVGVLFLIDGVFSYYSDGKYVPIMMTVDEMITFVRPASAATLGDYYLSSGENFRRFMQLDVKQAVQVMDMNPELALTVRSFAQLCRQQFGAENCK